MKTAGIAARSAILVRSACPASAGAEAPARTALMARPAAGQEPEEGGCELLGNAGNLHVHAGDGGWVLQGLISSEPVSFGFGRPVPISFGPSSTVDDQ